MAKRDRLSRMRLRTARDLERLHKGTDRGQFWRALAVLGSVGWPIVGLAVAGAWLGRYLDARWATQPRWTLILVGVGIAVGSISAYRSLRGGGP